MFSEFASATRPTVACRRLLLPVAFLVLGACAGKSDVKPGDAPESPQQSKPPQPTQIERLSPDATLRIAAVGDMMLGTDYPQNHLPDDDGAGFLQAVTPWLSSADITFGNLEGVLMDGGEPAKACKNPSACYLFRSPTRYVQHLVAAGFGVMSLANNHARDFGEEGRTSSMRALADAGIRHSGREGDFASFKAKGFTVALLAFAVTQESNLLHDYDLAASQVAEHAANHDIVIVSFHGGAEGLNVERLPFAEEEYIGEPRGDVVKFSRMMVDAGADLVLGHGPHVVRAMEYYKERLIAYSLGNFATYYGISVEGNRGIAPILVTTLDRDGRFVEGQIHSTIQIRPGGPVPDQEQRALKLIQSLSKQDFGTSGIDFQERGRIIPVKREFVRSKSE